MEKQDERHSYLQYKDDKFLKSLYQIAKKILDAPATPTQDKRLYIDAIEDINTRYFAAQQTKTATQGQFHKYDTSTEEHLREIIATEVSRCLGDLHTLIDAHISVIEAATTQFTKQYDNLQIRRDTVATFERTIATRTMKGVRDGWFPTLEIYYFSLNPGERAVEGRKRREERLYGSNETEGVVDLLSKQELNQITQQDLGQLKYINSKSNVNGHPVIYKLQTQYNWVLSP
ncbi:MULTISPECIES: hypothetical protein [Halorussus]|uniref:hypothetical protein n=1 Tax=Halorussus TaxID=1070314 RepID=UPI00209F398A|nr:hypothetical protein [Halorussus vallis]USZ78705.1 hypothetical protein NGM07_24655 [Halorussus vallis]